ncbi:MAG: hypothetical protein RLY92_1182, partial [Chloroflexota bacterium]
AGPHYGHKFAVRHTKAHAIQCSQRGVARAMYARKPLRLDNRKIWHGAN